MHLGLSSLSSPPFLFGVGVTSTVSKGALSSELLLPCINIRRQTPFRSCTDIFRTSGTFLIKVGRA